MTMTRQAEPTTKPPHFATLLVMALAPEDIGARISKRRKELGWTHEELARRMNVGLRTAQRWQKGRDPRTGKSWLPRLGTLMELADLMEVERSYFIENQAEPGEVSALSDRLQSLEDKVALGLGSLERAIDELTEQVRRRGAR